MVFLSSTECVGHGVLLCFWVFFSIGEFIILGAKWKRSLGVTLEDHQRINFLLINFPVLLYYCTSSNHRSIGINYMNRSRRLLKDKISFAASKTQFWFIIACEIKSKRGGAPNGAGWQQSGGQSPFRLFHLPAFAVVLVFNVIPLSPRQHRRNHTIPARWWWSGFD